MPVISGFSSWVQGPAAHCLHPRHGGAAGQALFPTERPPHLPPALAAPLPPVTPLTSSAAECRGSSRSNCSTMGWARPDAAGMQAHGMVSLLHGMTVPCQRASEAVLRTWQGRGEGGVAAGERAGPTAGRAGRSRRRGILSAAGSVPAGRKTNFTSTPPPAHLSPHMRVRRRAGRACISWASARNCSPPPGPGSGSPGSGGSVRRRPLDDWSDLRSDRVRALSRRHAAAVDSRRSTHFALCCR